MRLSEEEEQRLKPSCLTRPAEIAESELAMLLLLLCCSQDPWQPLSGGTELLQLRSGCPALVKLLSGIPVFLKLNLSGSLNVVDVPMPFSGSPVLLKLNSSGSLNVVDVPKLFSGSPVLLKLPSSGKRMGAFVPKLLSGSAGVISGRRVLLKLSSDGPALIILLSGSPVLVEELPSGWHMGFKVLSASHRWLSLLSGCSMPSTLLSE